MGVFRLPFALDAVCPDVFRLVSRGSISGCRHVLMAPQAGIDDSNGAPQARLTANSALRTWRARIDGLDLGELMGHKGRGGGAW